MFCEKCGNKLEDDELFCPFCGARVETEDSGKESDVTKGMGYGYGTSGGSSVRKEQPEKKRSERKNKENIDAEWEKEEKKEKITFIILGVIIILLVVAIVAGVIFLVKSGKETENERVPQLNEEMKEEMEQSKNVVDVTPEVQESAEEDIEGAIPEVTQEATPVPTQEVTPVPTQEVTPVPTQQPTPVPTQAPVVKDDSDDYVIPDSSTRYLTNADLNPLSEWEVRIARNEIYARHGRIFKTEEIASYFEGKSWYTPSISPEQFDNSYLNSIEIENLKFITNYEKAHNLNQ
ncbi:MAG: YARHG domain-containing protein [Oliverpabstia sp.]